RSLTMATEKRVAARKYPSSAGTILRQGLHHDYSSTRPSSRMPVPPATMTPLTRPRTMPCSSTPVTALMALAVAARSSMPSATLAARARLPGAGQPRPPPPARRRPAGAGPPRPPRRPPPQEGRHLDRHVGAAQPVHQLGVVHDDHEPPGRQRHHLLAEQRASV